LTFDYHWVYDRKKERHNVSVGQQIVEGLSMQKQENSEQKLKISGEKADRKWKGIRSICEGELQRRRSHH